MYSYGLPHMAEQKQDDQLEHTFSSYMRIRDVALKTYPRRWTIGRSGERGSGTSVLAARHDDDDNIYAHIYTRAHTCRICELHLCRGVRHPQLNEWPRYDTKSSLAEFGWGCRIHRLHLYRGVRSPNYYPISETNQSDGEAPVMLELFGMLSTPSLPSLPVPLWHGVVAPDRVLSMDQIELNCVLTLNWIVCNRTAITFNCV